MNTQEKEIVKRKIAELTAALIYIHLETGYCCFFDFSGHVDWARFRVTKSKAEYMKTIYPLDVFRGTVYLPQTDHVSIEDFVEQIDKAILDLKEFLK